MRLVFKCVCLTPAKGPAVHALRAQADKLEYQKVMRQILAKEPLLQIRQLLVDDIVLDSHKVSGVTTENGEFIKCSALVIATGTYLRGRIILGDTGYSAGPKRTKSRCKAF